MAQFNSLIVTGDSRFLNTIHGTCDSATNALTVNNHYVYKDVPSNAKFTDTWRPVSHIQGTAGGTFPASENSQSLAFYAGKGMDATLAGPDTEYGIKFINNMSGVYYVSGTQTAATAAWTGELYARSLEDGLSIAYYLPYAGVTSTPVTLELTLAFGDTTGPIDVYLNADTKLTTHYGAGRIIYMTYFSAGSISIAGTPTTTDRWMCSAYYDTNDVALNRPTYSHPVTGGRGIKQYSLYARISAGTYSSFTTGGGTGTKTFDGTYYFDPTKIFYYSGGSNVSAGTALGNNGVTLCCVNVDMRYSFNGVVATPSTSNPSSLTANSPVYLVLDRSSKNLGCYKLKSPYYTQTPSDTSALYVLLGYMRDSYRMDLWMYNPIFIWNGTYLYNYNEKRFDDIEPITGGSVTKYTSSLTFNILRSNIIKQGAVNYISFAITATGAVAASTKLLKIDTNHTASVAGTQNIIAMASDGKVYPMLLTNENGTTIIQSTSASALTNGVSYYVNGWYQ